MTTANITELEPSNRLWLLNHYRVAEMHSVAMIMRIARSADSSSLRANLSRQMRDEAAHSWMWTKLIREQSDSEIIGVKTPYHERLNLHYGLPRTLTELLALAWVSRKHSIVEYTEHLHAPDVPPTIQRMLRGILRDEERHVSQLNDELQQRMRDDLHAQDIVDRVLTADQQSVADLAAFAQPGQRIAADQPIP